MHVIVSCDLYTCICKFIYVCDVQIPHSIFAFCVEMSQIKWSIELERAFVICVNLT